MVVREGTGAGADAAPTHDGWSAELSLTFGRSGSKTVLRERRHRGPLTVQRPFYPEGPGVCHVYLLHPPGGVVGGDTLDVSITVEGDAHALITTPAATKFYRSDGRTAAQRQMLRVSAGTVLEWLPQETIFYNGARARLATRVELEPGGVFFGWEINCLGLPASGAPFEEGRVTQGLEIWQGGTPLLIEKGPLKGGHTGITARWGLGGYTVSATMAATTYNRNNVDAVRDAASNHAGDGVFSASWFDGLVVCRYLGFDGFRAQRCFAAAWEVLRRESLGRPVCAPRIWKT